MSPGLRHSVAIPTHPTGPETAERRNLLDLGRLVESAGFDALWVSEEAPPGLDSLVAVSALGTATSTIGLVAVVGPARRAPTVLAKSAAGSTGSREEGCNSVWRPVGRAR